MTFDLTDHARESLRKRPTILLEWVERVVQQPERVEPDSVDADLEHRLGRIPEYDGRVARDRQESHQSFADRHVLFRS